MKPLSQLLDQTIRKLPNSKRIKGQMIMDAWPEVVGGHICAKAQAVNFENGVLYVWVKDSVWAQHLSLQKKQIISKLNKVNKTRVLSDIRFQVGGRQPLAVCTENTAVKNNWRHQPLSCDKAGRIEAAFADSQLPPDLEEQIRSFLTAQEKRIQWLREQGYPECKICGMPVLAAGWEETCLCCKNGE